jgi:hypothetical protein
VIDSDQTGKPQPDAAYYNARTPGAASTGRQPPGQGSPGRQLSRRRRNIWKPVLLGMGCVVGAAWIVQAPQRPLLGLLGLLPLAMVVLATNPWGVRGRVPLIGSRNRVLAIGGWSLIGALLLVTEFFALSGAGALSGLSQSSVGNQASLGSPPSASSAAPPPAQAALPPPAAAPAAPPAAAPPAPPAPAPAPAKAARPAPPAAPAATPLDPVLNFLAPVIALINPSLAVELGLRNPAANSCPSHGAAHGGSGRGGHDHMSWTSGAGNGAASTWSAMQAQRCDRQGRG